MAQNNNIVCNFKDINTKITKLQELIEKCCCNTEQNDEIYTVKIGRCATTNENAIKNVEHSLMRKIPTYWSSFWSKGGIEFNFSQDSENTANVEINCPINSDSKILDAATALSIEVDAETGDSKIIAGECPIITNNTNLEDSILSSDIRALIEGFEIIINNYGATDVDLDFKKVTIGY